MLKDASTLNSCLYRVNVRHQRLLPKKHSFEYGLFMFMVDLDEAQEINRRLKLAKINRRAFYQFNDEDHFAVTPVSTKEKLAAFLLEKGFAQELGRVLLLTNFRFLGYVFNPVSIYFVYDKSGEPLLAVAEVGNTFLERKPFLLPRVFDDKTGKATFRLTAPKQFYVSPFSQVDDYFEFSCSSPDEQLEIHINTKSGSPQIHGVSNTGSIPLTMGATTLVSSLKGTRLELSDTNLFLCSLKYPFITFGVIGLIHFHALLLWMKKVPFFMKEEKVAAQTALLNPHRSLRGNSNESADANEKLTTPTYKGAVQ
jgi:DUF1365 family protein